MTQPRLARSNRASTLNRALQFSLAGSVLFFATGCPEVVEGGPPSSNAELANIEVSFGSIDFEPAETYYVTTSGYLESSLQLTPTAANSGAAITVAGENLASGSTTSVLLSEGVNEIDVVVTAEDGAHVLIYTLVYVRDDSASFAQDIYAKASNTGEDDFYGYSVAVSGDTVAVGSRLEDSNATGVNGDDASNSAGASGAVYVFRRDTVGTWVQEAYIKASNTAGGDEFGFAVALSGNSLAVGAPEEDSGSSGINGDEADNSASASGAVYVFRRDSQGAWSQEAYIKASNPDSNDSFGRSVALSGDKLAVGAPFEDSDAEGVDGNGADDSSLDSGAVYLYVRDSLGAWSQDAYAKGSNTNDGDHFGWSVALSGDTLAGGAPDEDSDAQGVDGNGALNSSTDSGAVYTFIQDSQGLWSQEAYIKASNTDAFDAFGFSVALAGDALAVGAYTEDSNASGIDGDEMSNTSGESGAVYAFRRGGPGGWSQEAYIKASNASEVDVFGSAVAISGDWLVVGAYLEDSSATGLHQDEEDNSASGSGAAYVFRRDGIGSWSQGAYVKASNTGGGDQFGYAVAISGGTVVIGAYRESSNATGIDGDQADNSANTSGAAYVFN